jgi:hypothetical protein
MAREELSTLEEPPIIIRELPGIGASSTTTTNNMVNTGCIHNKNNIVFGLGIISYEVFGLMNHSIQNEVVYHGSIPQIWWDDFIPHISTKQLTMRNEVVMD